MMIAAGGERDLVAERHPVAQSDSGFADLGRDRVAGINRNKTVAGAVSLAGGIDRKLDRAFPVRIPRYLE